MNRTNQLIAILVLIAVVISMSLLGLFFILYGKYDLYFVSDDQWTEISGYGLKKKYTTGILFTLDNKLNYNNGTFKWERKVSEDKVDKDVVSAYRKIKIMTTYKSGEYYNFYKTKGKCAGGIGGLDSFEENSYTSVYENY